MNNLIKSARVLRSARNPLRVVYGQPNFAASFSAAAARCKSFPQHVVIDMPASSPTMEAGNVGAWKKKIGDKSSAGDVLVEIETDKATMDFEFQDDGYLAQISLPEGTHDVPVGKPLGVYVEDEADVAAFKDFTIEDAGGAAAVPAAAKAEPTPEPAAAPASKPAEAPAAKPAPASAAPPAGKIFASPLAKTLALEKGIKLAEIKGTGPNGRVIARDVQNFQPSSASSASAGSATAASASPAAAAAAAYTDVPISAMRSTIAKRSRQSKNEAPDFIVSSQVSVSKSSQSRASSNASADGAYKISVNDILIKASAVACRKVPAPNTHWLESEKVSREFKNVDVSVAVSTPKGSITPIVSNAEAKGLAEISSEVKDLAKRARDNKSKPEEYQGGTITISNMGMNHAVSSFTAIINPPQSAIIAIGTTERKAIEDPLAENGISFDDVMNITGTFDHRVVDGAVAGEYMKALKTIIENPSHLML